MELLCLAKDPDMGEEQVCRCMAWFGSSVFCNASDRQPPISFKCAAMLPCVLSLKNVATRMHDTTKTQDCAHWEATQYRLSPENYDHLRTSILKEVNLNNLSNCCRWTCRQSKSIYATLYRKKHWVCVRSKEALAYAIRAWKQNFIHRSWSSTPDEPRTLALPTARFDGVW